MTILEQKVNELYDEAEESLDEAIRNNDSNDAAYWRGYRDAAQRLLEAVS